MSAKEIINNEITIDAVTKPLHLYSVWFTGLNRTYDETTLTANDQLKLDDEESNHLFLRCIQINIEPLASQVVHVIYRGTCANPPRTE